MVGWFRGVVVAAAAAAADDGVPVVVVAGGGVARVRMRGVDGGAIGEGVWIWGWCRG